jgi:hypothetical protein
MPMPMPCISVCHGPASTFLYLMRPYHSCSFRWFSGISSHPAVFFSHSKPTNSTFNHNNPAKRTGRRSEAQSEREGAAVSAHGMGRASAWSPASAWQRPVQRQEQRTQDSTWWHWHWHHRHRHRSRTRNCQRGELILCLGQNQSELKALFGYIRLKV